MNILFENPDKVNGLMTITVEEADIKEDVEKALKDYRKKANFPGFRPGMVPMGLVKKRFGASVRMDAVNKVVGEQMYNYIKENKIKMLGEPLPSDKQQPVDIEKAAPYTFVFDVAVAPEFTVKMDGSVELPYYEISADDKLIDEQIDMFASQMGSYEKAETFDPEERDMLKGDLRELDADGNTKEGGITVEGAVMMPQYIKVDEQKKAFDNAKLGDIITFNPRKAYPDNDAEVASMLKIEREQAKTMESDFSYQVTEISRFKKAEANQAMFDQVYGKDNVKSLEEFRGKIAESVKPELQANSDFKFMQDVRALAEQQAGQLTYPDAILKRVMLRNNPDKGEEFVEKNYEESIKHLTWHLIKEQLVEANNVKVEDADVKQAAIGATRAQFAQYGMTNVPNEYIEKYADEMLAKRENIDNFVDSAIEKKLAEVLKTTVKLDVKNVTLAEFNDLVKQK